jgi:hypothetical protein
MTTSCAHWLQVLSNWQTQVSDHTKGNLRVYLYYGKQCFYAYSKLPTLSGCYTLVVTSWITHGLALIHGMGGMGFLAFLLVLAASHGLLGGTSQKRTVIMTKPTYRYNTWMCTAVP